MTETEALAALAALEDEYPTFELWLNGLSHGEWLWFGRGREGNPWLIMSADLDRFQRWLAAEAH